MILQKHLSVILDPFLCKDFLLCFVVPKVRKDFAVGQFQALCNEGNGAGAHQNGNDNEGRWCGNVLAERQGKRAAD